MSDVQAIADRIEIEALRGEFTDAVMMRDYDRLASLFTQEGSVRIPNIDAEAVSREQIRSGVARLQGLWEFFVQTVHPGTIRLEGDTASGRAPSASLRSGTSTQLRWRARRPTQHRSRFANHDRLITEGLTTAFSAGATKQRQPRPSSRKLTGDYVP